MVSMQKFNEFIESETTLPNWVDGEGAHIDIFMKELCHRASVFVAIMQEAEHDLKNAHQHTLLVLDVVANEAGTPLLYNAVAKGYLDLDSFGTVQNQSCPPLLYRTRGEDRHFWDDYLPSFPSVAVHSDVLEQSVLDKYEWKISLKGPKDEFLSSLFIVREVGTQD